MAVQACTSVGGMARRQQCQAFKAVFSLMLPACIMACGTPTLDGNGRGPYDPDSTSLATSLALATEHFLSGDLDSAALLTNALLDSARTLMLPMQEVTALNMLGRLAMERAHLDSATNCFRSAASIARTHGAATDLARSLLNLGLAHERQGRYEDALRADLQAIHLFDSVGDQRRVAQVKHNLSMLHMRLNDRATAMASLNEAIDIKRNIGDVEGAANSIGVMGYLMLEQGLADSAIVLLKRSLAVFDSLGMGATSADHVLNLGLAYDERGDDDTAMVHYGRAMQLAIERDDPEIRMVLLNNIGDILLDKGDVRQAEQHFKQSLAIADSIGSVEDQRIAHGSLAQLYEATGDHALALAEFKLGEALADTLMNQQRQSTMNELLVNYEAERKERENERLKAQNEETRLKSERAWGWAVAMAALAVIVALLAFMLVRARRIRARERETELEQQALRAQMDPHFLFNALNTIPGLYASVDTITASKYVGHLSGLLRAILASSRQPVVPLRQELELVQNYLHVSTSRHPDQFTWQLKIDPGVDQDRIDLPSMILQPLVENAIVHGLIPRGEDGHLTIEVSRAGKLLVCRIQDNGVGLGNAPRAVVDVQHVSQGLRITAERILRFNHAEPSVQGLSIEDLKNARGASIGTVVVVRTLINNAPRP